MLDNLKYNISDIKYRIGDRVIAKINYQNDPRNEVEAVICGVELDSDIDRINYKIHMEPTEFDKKMGCTSYIGYVYQENILGLL